MATPEQQAIIDSSAAEFREAIHGRLIDKKDENNTTVISESFENLLVTSYHELMNAVIDADALRWNDKRRYDAEWKKTQAGVFAKITGYIMASEDVKNLQCSDENKQRIAMRFAGTIVYHVTAAAADKLRIMGFIDPVLFGHTRESARGL